MRLLQWTVLLAALIFTSQASAVNFSYKDINGKKRQLSDYKGKWVIVNYWGTRCAPCRAEIPELNRIARKYRSNTKIIGIELMSSKDSEIKAFMAKNGMRFTVAGTQRSVISPLGTIRTLPTTFIISPEGNMVNKHAGIVTERYVRGFIKGDTQVAKQEGPSKEEIARIEKEKQNQAEQAVMAEKRKLAEQKNQDEQMALADKRRQTEEQNQAEQRVIAEKRQQAEQDNQAKQVAAADQKQQEAQQQAQAAQQAAQQKSQDVQRAAQAAKPKAPVAAKAPAPAKKSNVHDMLMNYKF